MDNLFIAFFATVMVFLLLLTGGAMVYTGGLLLGVW